MLYHQAKEDTHIQAHNTHAHIQFWLFSLARSQHVHLIVIKYSLQTNQRNNQQNNAYFILYITTTHPPSNTYILTHTHAHTAKRALTKYHKPPPTTTKNAHSHNQMYSTFSFSYIYNINEFIRITRDLSNCIGIIIYIYLCGINI